MIRVGSWGENGEEGPVARPPAPEPGLISFELGLGEGGLESIVIKYATVQLFDHLCPPA